MSKQAQATVSPRAARRRVGAIRMREIMDAYGMLMPTILGAGIFFAVPLAISFYLSFTNARLFGTPSLIGFDNYIRVFGDPTFYSAMINTAVFSVSALFLSTVPALFLAVLSFDFTFFF